MNRERMEIVGDAFHLINHLSNLGEWDKIKSYFKLIKEDDAQVKEEIGTLSTTIDSYQRIDRRANKHVLDKV